MLDKQHTLPWASLTRPVMMMTIRARTLATVETTWRIAPHFTFIQFTKVSRPDQEKQEEDSSEQQFDWCHSITGLKQRISRDSSIKTGDRWLYLTSSTAVWIHVIIFTEGSEFRTAAECACHLSSHAAHACRLIIGLTYDDGSDEADGVIGG